MQPLTVPIVTLVNEHIIAHGILSYLTASTSKQTRAVDTNRGLYLQIALYWLVEREHWKGKYPTDLEVF